MRHAGGEEIYIRSGSTSQKASREQQARLYDAGGMLHIETMPVSGTSIASLDMARLENYLVLGRKLLKNIPHKGLRHIFGWEVFRYLQQDTVFLAQK